jgi:hypothetical protein
MKFLNIFKFLWVFFALLDPDPNSESGSRVGSTDLIKSGSNPDPGSGTLVFRLRTHLHDGEQVGEVLIHGGGDGDQLIVA